MRMHTCICMYMSYKIGIYYLNCNFCNVLFLTFNKCTVNIFLKVRRIAFHVVKEPKPPSVTLVLIFMSFPLQFHIKEPKTTSISLIGHPGWVTTRVPVHLGGTWSVLSWPVPVWTINWKVTPPLRTSARN